MMGHVLSKLRQRWLLSYVSLITVITVAQNQNGLAMFSGSAEDAIDSAPHPALDLRTRATVETEDFCLSRKLSRNSGKFKTKRIQKRTSEPHSVDSKHV